MYVYHKLMNPIRLIKGNLHEHIILKYKVGSTYILFLVNFRTCFKVFRHIAKSLGLPVKSPLRFVVAELLTLQQTEKTNPTTWLLLLYEHLHLLS